MMCLFLFWIQTLDSKALKYVAAWLLFYHIAYTSLHFKFKINQLTNKEVSNIIGMITTMTPKLSGVLHNKTRF